MRSAKICFILPSQTYSRYRVPRIFRTCPQHMVYNSQSMGSLLHFILSTPSVVPTISTYNTPSWYVDHRDTNVRARLRKYPSGALKTFEKYLFDQLSNDAFLVFRGSECLFSFCALLFTDSQRVNRLIRHRYLGLVFDCRRRHWRAKILQDKLRWICLTYRKLMD